jgi:anti-sigma factor RsiW
MATRQSGQSRLNELSMNRCQDFRAGMSLYLDDELQGRERLAFEKHLRNCEPCCSLFENERQFLEIVRRAPPLHIASPELRGRVEELVNNLKDPPLDSLHLQQFIEPRLWQKTFNFRGLVAISAAFAILLLLVIWLVSREKNEVPPGGPSEFALMAANTHLRHLRGQLPLEVVSEAPQRISSWFNDKLPFSVKLPNYQESSGQEKLYKLEGARLVGYKNDYAAYVAYQMRQRPISLVITSNSVARPAGGQEIVAKGLTFHYDSINGLKVITWSDRGLTYALVSDLEERGQQSCVVCHHGTSDREFIESLKPQS